jgi:hypothetical protein
MNQIDAFAQQLDFLGIVILVLAVAAVFSMIFLATSLICGSLRNRRYNRALAIEAEALRRVKLNAELNAATPLDRRD